MLDPFSSEWLPNRFLVIAGKRKGRIMASEGYDSLCPEDLRLTLALATP